MNKKIKIIELLSRIKHGEELPKRIRYKNNTYIYNKQRNNYYYRNHEIYISECLKDILNLEVEVLEDNTEEIEELELIPQNLIENCSDRNFSYLAIKYNEILTVINQLRKEKK